ncbi:MAG: HAD-IIIA family hydrolase, partial [Thermodesulfobacteriota bacterium]
MDLEGKRPAVFLDRDVTIIEDVPYLFEPDKVKLIKGAGEAIKNLNSLGFWVLVVTNQSGVGRGYFKEADVEAVHKRLSSLLD